RNVVRPPEDVHHVDRPRDLTHRTVDGATEYLGDVRVVHRHRHDVVPGALHVLSDVKGGLFALSFGLDTEHCDAPRLAENPRDLVPRRHEMLPPALRHARRLAHLRGRGGPQGSTEIMTEFLLTDLLLGEHHLRTVLHLARLIVEARSDDVGAP